MGEVCLNGWDAIGDPNDPRLAWTAVPGTSKRVLVRKEAAPLFAAILADVNAQVIPLDPGPLDGWEYREARAGSGLSNHAGGVATDMRYDVLLADRQRHMSDRQTKTMHALLDKYVTSYGKRIFGWGGDWDLGTYMDEMHLELIQSWSPGSQGSDCTLADVNDAISYLGLGKAKPEPKPLPSGSGPKWVLKFLKAVGCPPHMRRAWWSIIMRESGGDPTRRYPAGAPFGNWARSTAPYFDTGILMINNRHLDAVRKMFGKSATMELMLDPVKAWRYAQTLNWKDWGLVISPDGKSYRFDWSGYPADWVAKYAAESEARFREQWDAFTQYVKKPKKVS